jgi:DnaJ-class molecular chaperone
MYVVAKKQLRRAGLRTSFRAGLFPQNAVEQRQRPYVELGGFAGKAVSVLLLDDERRCFNGFRLKFWIGYLFPMAEDYYKTLGISKSATTGEIQKAYRKLARQYHPDRFVDSDDKERANAKQMFQKVQQAYDVLSDQNKRQLYDQYGEGFDQMAGGNPFAGAGRAGGGGNPYGSFDFSQIFGGAGGAGGKGGGGFEDILRQMGGGARRGGPQAPPPPSKDLDIEKEITISFGVAVLGGKHQLRLTRPNGKVESIDIKIPAGIEQGQKIRLKGQGHSGPRGASGDLMVKVKIAGHPKFTRTGLNLNLTVPITLREAAEGAKIDVPTPHGTVTLSVPPGSSSGKSLRLKGMGIRAKNGSGDQYVTLQIVIPEEITPDQMKLLHQLKGKWNEQVREELHW